MAVGTFIMLASILISTCFTIEGEIGSIIGRHRTEEIRKKLLRLKNSVSAKNLASTRDINNLQAYINDAQSIIYKLAPQVRSKVRRNIQKAQNEINRASNKINERNANYEEVASSAPTITGGIIESYKSDDKIGLTEFNDKIERSIEE